MNKKLSKMVIKNPKIQKRCLKCPSWKIYLAYNTTKKKCNSQVRWTKRKNVKNANKGTEVTFYNLKISF